MSYDLAVWEGPRPADNAAALAEYERLMAQWYSGTEWNPTEPTTAVTAFIDALNERRPDWPWSGDLADSATGPMIYFTADLEAVEELWPIAAEVATPLGLVCFDPQIGELI